METIRKQLTLGMANFYPVAAVCDRRVDPVSALLDRCSRQSMDISRRASHPQAQQAPSPQVAQESRLRPPLQEGAARQRRPVPLSPLQAPSSPRLYPNFNLLYPKSRAAAFTLIESIVAIGLFAFVIVGIVGLFGSALQRQRQASFETRSVMVAQQVLARIRAADSSTNVTFTRGSDPVTQGKMFHSLNLATAPAIAFYFKRDGTEVSGLTPVSNYEQADYTPFPGYDADGRPGDIVGRARATLTANQTAVSDLYRVTIEVSEPANLPLNLRRYTNTFTTFATFPN